MREEKEAVLEKSTVSRQKNNKVHWSDNPYSILGEEEEADPELMDVNDVTTRQHRNGPRLIQVESE